VEKEREVKYSRGREMFRVWDRVNPVRDKRYKAQRRGLFSGIEWDPTFFSLLFLCLFFIAFHFSNHDAAALAIFS
jgi:hypothetical protein